ncbi:MAG: metallopeptidase family protein [Planctomycetota bacterium]
MSPADQQRFDALVEEAIENLPPALAKLLDEVPVIVLDTPTPDMLKSLGIDAADTQAIDELCGLHTGTSITDESVERPALTSDIHLFRQGILSLAGGWEPPQDPGASEPDTDDGPDAHVYDEIMVTLLHEIGHQFGLDEDDLEQLGYD